MAKIELLVPKILKWEGGYVNDPADAGGATNMGVTLNTWRHMGYDKDLDGDIDADDMKKLTPDDFKIVLRKYWDRWKADEIINQHVAETLVDWVWASGVWGILIPQRVLNQSEDGNAGPKTIKAINDFDDQSKLHAALLRARVNFVDRIVKKSISKYDRELGRPSTLAEQLKHTNKRFEKGWLNRINSYKYE